MKLYPFLRKPRRREGGGKTGVNECSWNFPLGPRAQCQLHALPRNSFSLRVCPSVLWMLPTPAT